MGLISLFLQDKNKIHVMELDATINESHEMVAQITSNPVEDGTNVADNVVLQPRKVTIEGMVSPTPLGAQALIGSAIQAGVSQLQAATNLPNGIANIAVGSIGGLVASSVGNALLGSDGPNSRSPRDVFKYLEELYESRTPIDVQTGLKKYENMIVANVNVPVGQQTGQAIRFTVVLEHVTIVQAVQVDLSGFADTVAAGAAEAANLGKQAAKAATSKTEEAATVAYSLLGF